MLSKNDSYSKFHLSSGAPPSPGGATGPVARWNEPPPRLLPGDHRRLREPRGWPATLGGRDDPTERPGRRPRWNRPRCSRVGPCWHRTAPWSRSPEGTADDRDPWWLPPGTSAH